jgi:hypothetical protein
MDVADAMDLIKEVHLTGKIPPTQGMWSIHLDDVQVGCFSFARTFVCALVFALILISATFSTGFEWLFC